MHYSYTYDENANFTVINDHIGSGTNDRAMTYDGLDRLKSADSPMLGGTIQYGYDQIDNITKLSGARNALYCYNNSKQLAFVRSGTSCTSGPVTTALEYDIQGNVASKNEVDYTFDYGNRLREVEGRGHYRYDAHGRRILPFLQSQGKPPVAVAARPMLYRACPNPKDHRPDIRASPAGTAGVRYRRAHVRDQIPAH